MSLSQTILGGGVVVGLVTAVLQSVAPDASFMLAHEISYTAGQVTARRTIEGPDTIADWRVTIVGTDGASPVCSTVPGDDLHQGWSWYVSGYSESVMSVDDWVGQVGCYEGMASGEYTMFMNWTPRDGRPPAYTSTTFTK